MNLKKGDHVVVLKGKDRGKDGVIMRVLPKDGKVIVEGVNVVKKHQKATRATMQAGIIDKDMPIDASNDARPGDRVRVMETRPLSKLKRWRIVEVLERAK